MAEIYLQKNWFHHIELYDVVEQLGVFERHKDKLLYFEGINATQTIIAAEYAIAGGEHAWIVTHYYCCCCWGYTQVMFSRKSLVNFSVIRWHNFISCIIGAYSSEWSLHKKSPIHKVVLCPCNVLLLDVL